MDGKIDNGSVWKTLYKENRRKKQKVKKYLEKPPGERVTFVVPQNLSKKFLLSKKPLDFSDEEWISICYFVMGTLSDMGLDKRYSGLQARAKYYPLYSVLLKKYLGSDYAHILQYLITLGLIDTSGRNGKKGAESIGYRLGKSYRGQNIKFRTITCPLMKAKILRFRRQEAENQKKRLSTLPYLVQWYATNKLTLDKPAAEEYLSEYKATLLYRIAKNKRLTTELKEEMVCQVKDKVALNLSALAKWGSADWRLSIDDAGRLYSRLSSLMSPLRNFLTYDGESLISLDLKNSQPMHIVFLLKPDFWYKTESPRSLHKLNGDLYKYLYQTGVLSQILMWLQKPESRASTDFPFANFELLVQTGKLYKFIANHFAGHFIMQNGFDRFDSLNKAKVEMLRIMYFDNRKAEYHFYKPFKRFEQIFPSVAKVITALKSKRYQDFPVLLQRLEAQIIFPAQWDPKLGIHVT